MMPIFQEWQQSGSGTRKQRLSLGDLFTTSSTCATITDLIREPLLDNIRSQMFTSSQHDHLKIGTFYILIFLNLSSNRVRSILLRCFDKIGFNFFDEAS